MNYVSWPEDPENSAAFQVAPSSTGNKTINTIVAPKTKTYVFWASPNLLTPVSKQWYIHAASVPGAGQEFDVIGDKTVRWEHFEIGGDGLTALQLLDDRTYVFYLTPESVDENKLKSGHFPWVARAHRVLLSPSIDYILFPAQPLILDDHAKDVAQDDTFSTDTTLAPVLVFESDEHLDVGQSAQRMIDYWATNGLIDGGALIDSSQPKVGEWKLLLPYKQENATPIHPYGIVPETTQYHWHYVFPDSKVDGAGNAWTSDSLKDAIQTGKAVAVTVGQLVILTGDYYGSFEDMSMSKPREPVNIMKGFDEDDRFAFMIMDLVNFDRWGINQLRYMKNVKESQKDAEKWEKKNRGKVKKLVSILRDARGPSRFSEIHLLGQLWSGRLGSTRKMTGFPLKELEERLPWFKPDRAELSSVLGAEEMGKLDSPGFDDEFFSMAVTNGHYAELALDNAKHFDPLNCEEFKKYHARALQLIDEHTKHSPTHRNPIPAESIARTACGLHFLTDAFSAGHMRVPRSALGRTGAIAAKLMHDMDGLYGLHVHNDFKIDWRAFGDGHLNPDSITGIPQKFMLEKLNTSAGTNRDKALEVVGSAFKQLHYEAQKVCAKDPRFKKILRNSRGNMTFQLMWDKEAHGAGSEKSNIEEKIAQDVNGRIAYMEMLRPKPYDVGRDSSDVRMNHPPLFLPNGDLNTGPNAYDKLGTFELRLKWHSWGGDVLKNPNWQVRLDFTKFYYVSVYTKGAGGWIGEGQTKLLDTYDKLPKG